MSYATLRAAARVARERADSVAADPIWEPLADWLENTATANELVGVLFDKDGVVNRYALAVAETILGGAS